MYIVGLAEADACAFESQTAVRVTETTAHHDPAAFP
jgi:hypothetical protein